MKEKLLKDLKKAEEDLEKTIQEHNKIVEDINKLNEQKKERQSLIHRFDERIVVYKDLQREVEKKEKK